MELQEVLRRRRTIRDFSNAVVPFSIVEKALQAGLKAPSYNHLKQWDFVLVNDKSVRLQLCKTEKMKEEMDDELIKAFENYNSLVREMYLDAIPKQKKMIMEAPELLVIVYKPKTQVKESQRVLAEFR